MEKLNVGIADDNELIVSLLSDIVAQDEELRVVGTARNGEEAYRQGAFSGNVVYGGGYDRRRAGVRHCIRQTDDDAFVPHDRIQPERSVYYFADGMPPHAGAFRLHIRGHAFL